MANDLFLLWLAAFPLMGSPGPATLSLAGIGTAFGFKRGISYLLGIITGTTGVLLLIATGVTALILTQPFLVRALAIGAAFYILYLSWRIATAPVGAMNARADAVPSFWSGFTLAIANPKAFVAIGAVYAGRALIDNDIVADTLAKIAALTFVIVVVNTAWLLLGSVFSKLFSHPRSGRIANIVMALMLVFSVAIALAGGKPSG